MAHKAVIKANRKDVEWYYRDRSFEIELCKSYCSDEWWGYRYKSDWERLVKEFDLNTKLHHTGTFTLEEKEINSDILHEGHNIYVSYFDSYCTIKKVEVNDSGDVNYYIDEYKTFYDNAEESRLKSIEEWFKKEYPEVEKFEDLIKYKDERCKYVLELEEYDKNLFNKYSNKDDVEKLTDNITLVKTKDDSKEEFYGLMTMLGILLFIVALFLPVFLN